MLSVRLPVSLLLGIGLLGAAPGLAHARAASDPPSLRAAVKANGGSAADAGSDRYVHLRRLDASLQWLAATPPEDARTVADSLQVGSTTRGHIEVEITLIQPLSKALDDVLDGLRSRGLRVTATLDGQVSGTVDPQRLEELATGPGVRSISAVVAEQTNAGSIASIGDTAHAGPAARALGPTGAGVMLGVISDTINKVGGGIVSSQASGDLPSNVQILAEHPTGADEGRAMAEIVFDGAPGISNMAFHTGFGGATTRAAGIDALVAAGARVIVDDVVHITEPFFQDGVVAQAADRAVAAGVVYVVSAGNRARQAWERTYSPVPTPGGPSADTFDFDPGPAIDTIQRIGTFSPLAGGPRNMAISLQWDDPWGRATTNLALDVYSIDTATGAATLLSTVDADNLVTGLPREYAAIQITAPNTTIGIGIRRVAGARAPLVRYVVTGTPVFTISEYPTNSPAIDPDAAAAAGPITVAAVGADDPGRDTPQAFSSRGPVTRLFDPTGSRLVVPEIRAKPDLAGADKIATSVPGFNPFFGTSAGAPSIAAIAALVRSARPELPATSAVAILRDPRNSIDCTTSAGQPDVDCGSGFLLADRAVQQALDRSAPLVTPTTSVRPNRDGTFTGPVTVSFTTSDPDSPVVSRNGCDGTVVPDGQSKVVTCTLTSVGGTASASVEVRRPARVSVASTIPRLSGFRMAPQRIVARPGSSTTLRVRTNQKATLIVTIERRIGGRRYRAVGQLRAGGTAGRTVRVRIRSRVGRRLLAPGRYRVTVVGQNALRQTSAPVRGFLTVTPPIQASPARR